LSGRTLLFPRCKSFPFVICYAEQSYHFDVENYKYSINKIHRAWGRPFQTSHLIWLEKWLGQKFLLQIWSDTLAFHISYFSLNFFRLNPTVDWLKIMVRDWPELMSDQDFLGRIGSNGLWVWPYPYSPQILLCKKEIPYHIKMSVNAWSIKCRWNHKLIAQFCCTLRDEHFESN
jgi:hypothetical protein